MKKHNSFLISNENKNYSIVNTEYFKKNCSVSKKNGAKNKYGVVRDLGNRRSFSPRLARAGKSFLFWQLNFFLPIIRITLFQLCSLQVDLVLCAIIS